MDGFTEALDNKQYWSARETNSRTAGKAEKPGKAGSGELKWERETDSSLGKGSICTGSDGMQVRIKSQSAATWV